MEGYVRCLERERVDCDIGGNVEQIWKHVKRAMVHSAREVCGLVRVGEKKPKNILRNDVVKAAVERKEAAWKEVLGAREDIAKDRCMEVYKD